MQVNTTNDSPRHPIWQAAMPVTFPKQFFAASPPVVDTRRCICGAKQSEAGTLPCNH